jgi:hypothetical protein
MGWFSGSILEVNFQYILALFYGLNLMKTAISGYFISFSVYITKGLVDIGLSMKFCFWCSIVGRVEEAKDASPCSTIKGEKEK